MRVRTEIVNRAAKIDLIFSQKRGGPDEFRLLGAPQAAYDSFNVCELESPLGQNIIVLEAVEIAFRVFLHEDESLFGLSGLSITGDKKV